MSDLDEAHAAFYAEAKLLGLSNILETESNQLLEVAGDMFEIRKKASEDRTLIKSELKPIYSRFGDILQSIRAKISSKGIL